MLQKTFLRDAASMTFSETYKVDLPKQGALSALLLEFSSNQQSAFGSAAGPWRLLDYISRIKVVGDGSEVVIDATPAQLQAMQFYDQHVSSLDVLRNYATNTQFCKVLVPFGRQVGDRLLGLNLGKFNNVDLEISNTATSTQFQTDIDVTITMLTFHPDFNPPAFSGHLRREIWRQWTGVQDERKYLELPTSWKIRRIMVQAIPGKTDSLEDTTFWNCLYDVLLTTKTGATKLIDCRLEQLVRLNALRYGLPEATIIGAYFTADTAHDLGIGYPLTVQATPMSYTGAGATAAPTVTAGDTIATQRMETAQADMLYSLYVKGLGIHDTAVVWEGDSDDPADYLDPQALNVVELQLHTRNSSSADAGTNYVVLERLVA
jgi:hypothetical protein